MSLPELKTVTRTQGHNQALKTRAVEPRTCVFDFVEVDPLIRAFREMVREQKYDVCELAITTYLCAKAHGKPFTAVPVFPMRGLHHGAIVTSTRSGVRTPEDLAGRRVGVNRGYTVTTGVWVRGILQDEYGVDLDGITWMLSGDEHVAEYRPPTNVLPIAADEDIAEMLVSGELAAAVGVQVDHPDVVPLIPEPAEAGLRSLRERGLYPINHLIVIKDSVLDQMPELAVDVFNAFAEAKADYLPRLCAGELTDPTTTDRTYATVAEEIGDPLPYGVDANRAMLEKIVDHAVAQRIIPDRPTVESLFHPSTVGLSG